MIFLLADPARGYYATLTAAETPGLSYRRLSEVYGGPCCGDAALRFGLDVARRVGLTLMTLSVSALVPAAPNDVPDYPPVEPPASAPLPVVEEPPATSLFTFGGAA